VLRKLGKQPVEKLDGEERIEFQALFADRIFAQDVRVGKAGVLGFANQSSLREGTGQSARERGFAVQHGARQLPVDDRIGEDQPPAGLEHAIQFAKGLPLFGGKVEDAMGDDHVHAGIGQGNVFHPAFAKLNVGQAEGFLIGPSACQHLRRHIQTDGDSCGSDLVGGKKGVNPRAAAHVQHVFARLQIRVTNRIAQPQRVRGDRFEQLGVFVSRLLAPSAGERKPTAHPALEESSNADDDERSPKAFRSCAAASGVLLRWNLTSSRRSQRAAVEECKLCFSKCAGGIEAIEERTVERNHEICCVLVIDRPQTHDSRPRAACQKSTADAKHIVSARAVALTRTARAGNNQIRLAVDPDQIDNGQLLSIGQEERRKQRRFLAKPGVHGQVDDAGGMECCHYGVTRRIRTASGGLTPLAGDPDNFVRLTRGVLQAGWRANRSGW